MVALERLPGCLDLDVRQTKEQQVLTHGKVDPFAHVNLRCLRGLGVNFSATWHVTTSHLNQSNSKFLHRVLNLKSTKISHSSCTSFYMAAVLLVSFLKSYTIYHLPTSDFSEVGHSKMWCRSFHKKNSSSHGHKYGRPLTAAAAAVTSSRTQLFKSK